MTNKTYKYRLATEDDIESIMQIMEQAKAQMRRESRCQWDDTYPVAENIRSDIKNGYGMVFVCDQDIIAYGALIYDGEPTYNHLDGQWLSEQPYAVVHRLAVNDRYKGMGMALLFLQYIQDYASKKVHSFKIDTNFDNKYMLRIIERLGFSYCGKVYYERGERLAFEKLI